MSSPPLVWSPSDGLRLLLSFRKSALRATDRSAASPPPIVLLRVKNAEGGFGERADSVSPVSFCIAIRRAAALLDRLKPEDANLACNISSEGGETGGYGGVNGLF